jgi:hypothetical protein
LRGEEMSNIQFDSEMHRCGAREVGGWRRVGGREERRKGEKKKAKRKRVLLCSVYERVSYGRVGW